MSINQVILMGRMGKDPVVKTASNGKQFVMFTMATTEKWQEAEHTTWHDVIGFGWTVNQVSELKKGAKVFLKGKLQKKKDKNDNWRVSIVCDHIVGSNSLANQENTQQNNFEFDSDEEVPF